MACTTRSARVSAVWSPLRQLAILLASLSMATHASAHNDLAWPKIPLPDHVDMFEVGKEIVVNGMPMRVQGFVAQATPAEVAASMRKLLGSPLVEDHLGATLVLGRSQGLHYITVQLAPLGTGTRALIAITTPSANMQDQANAVADRRLLAALPAGSTLVNHTSSVDGAVRAEQTAVVNSHGIDINGKYLKRMLHAEGFTLEREARAMPGAQGYKSTLRDTRMMFFKRAGTEAVAVIARDDKGQSVVVLNRVHLEDRFK